MSETDLDKHVEMLSNCQIIKESEVKQLCVKARELLIDEGNVQKVMAPCTIVGDIHGMFNVNDPTRILSGPS